MGEDFAFEYQVCIILHNFPIVYDFDTFSISFHSSPEDGGRWGRRWEKDFAFEFQVCIVLHIFAIFSDFDSFSRYRDCFALITFHSSPKDGGRWGRRWEKTLRLKISCVSFCVILRYSVIAIPFLHIAAVLPHFVSLVPRGPPRTGDDRVEDGRRLRV